MVPCLLMTNLLASGARSEGWGWVEARWLGLGGDWMVGAGWRLRLQRMDAACLLSELWKEADR